MRESTDQQRCVPGECDTDEQHQHGRPSVTTQPSRVANGVLEEVIREHGARGGASGLDDPRER